MRWLLAKKRQYLKPKGKGKHKPKKPGVFIPEPMHSNRAPYTAQYPYSYDSPYSSGGGTGGYTGYSDGGQSGIKMDPEKYIGLGLGKGK